MPFESLSEKIQMSISRLTGRGKDNENDIEEAMREVRVSLLEADVNYKIVKKFIADVKEKALGERIDAIDFVDAFHEFKKVENKLRKAKKYSSNKRCLIYF